MHPDFSKIVADLTKAGAFTRIFNAVRPSGEYIFSTFLPEMTSPEYFVDTKYMTVRSLMAGLVGTDSEYPKTGWTETEGQMLRTLKIANSVDLTEEAQRTLQSLARQNALNGPEEVLNFFNKVIVQPHLDTVEWMRGQALANVSDADGGNVLDWSFGRAKARVVYKRDTGWDLPQRTLDDAYDGATSKFWDDVIAAYEKLHYSVKAVVMNAAMLTKIVNNPVNKIVVDSMSPDGRTVTLRRTTDDGTQYVLDGRFTVTVTVYDGSGEVYNPATQSLVQIPFMPDGKILFVGNYVSNKIYTVGQGSSDQPEATSLGYTHIAPTIEGGGVPGRWGRVYVPQNAPWRLSAEGVQNVIPVIEEPKLTVIARG